LNLILSQRVGSPKGAVEHRQSFIEICAGIKKLPRDWHCLCLGPGRAFFIRNYGKSRAAWRWLDPGNRDECPRGPWTARYRGLQL